jgi:hypothetical protein
MDPKPLFGEQNPRVWELSLWSRQWRRGRRRRRSPGWRRRHRHRHTVLLRARGRRRWVVGWVGPFVRGLKCNGFRSSRSCRRIREERRRCANCSLPPKGVTVQDLVPALAPPHLLSVATLPCSSPPPAAPAGSRSGVRRGLEWELWRHHQCSGGASRWSGRSRPAARHSCPAGGVICSILVATFSSKTFFLFSRFFLSGASEEE